MRGRARAASAVAPAILWGVGCGLPVPVVDHAVEGGSHVAGAGPDSAFSPPPPLDPRPDPSFGASGEVAGDLARWTPAGVAIDDRGRLVVSGPGSYPSMPLADVVRRFAIDGTLDTTFGVAGTALVDVNPETWNQAVLAQSDGGIGILGAAVVEGGEGAFEAWLDPDGADDAGVTPKVSLVAAGMFSMALWSADATGFVLGGGGTARVARSGAVDPTYGDAGFVSAASAGALAADGRLWTAEASHVSRYLPDGAADPAFGIRGSVDLAWSDPDAGASVVPVVGVLLADSDGGATAVGAHPSPPSFDVDLVRLTPTGALDPAFARGGRVSLASVGAPQGAARLADGRIVVWTYDGELLVVLDDGTPQGTFNLDVPGTILDAAIDSQVRLVVLAMDTSDPLRNRWLIRRYLLD